MAKFSIKEKFYSISNEISKQWIISIVTGAACAFIAGLYALISPFVPLEFKQPDVLFVLSLHLITFISGFVLVIFAKNWLQRLLPLFLPLIALVTFFLYMNSFILYGISYKKGQKIIIFYPDEFKNRVMKAEWKRAVREIPGTLNIQGISINLLKWSHHFSGDIEKTLIGKKIDNRPDVLGYIEMTEKTDSVLIQLKLPSLQRYYDLGCTYVETVSQLTQKGEAVELIFGFDSFNVVIEFQNQIMGPHLGNLDFLFNYGIQYTNNPVSLSNIARLRNLPVEDTLEIPQGNLSRGIYFAANMIGLAYFKLAGHESVYCEILDEFTRFDERKPDFELLSYLDIIALSNCLFKKGPEYIERIIKLDTEKRDEILSTILSNLMPTDEYDHLYEDSEFFPAGTIADLEMLRKYGRLDIFNPDYAAERGSFLFNIMKEYEGWQNSNPILWQVLADKVQQLLNTGLFSQLFMQSSEYRDFYLENYLTVSNYLDFSQDSIELPWILYLQFELFQMIVSKPDFWLQNLDNIANRISLISEKTNKQDILIFGWNLTDFLQKENEFKSTKKDIRQLIDSINNKKTMRELIQSSMNVIAPFISKDSELRPYFHDYSLYTQDEIFKQYLNFFLEIVKKTTSDKLSSGIEKIIKNIFGNYSADQFLNSTFAEFTQFLDKTDKKKVTKNLNLLVKKIAGQNFKLIDPMSMEVMNFFQNFPEFGSKFSQEFADPVLMKNPFQKILLYRLLADYVDESAAVKKFLKTMVSYYPQEWGKPVFKHFQLVESHLSDNQQKAIELAQEIITNTNQSQRSFYYFYLDSLETKKLEPTCEPFFPDLPAWTWYLINNDRMLILDHVLLNTNSKLWKKTVETRPYYQAGYNENQNYYLFIHALSRYFIEYSQEKSTDEIDEKLMQAINNSKETCP